MYKRAKFSHYYMVMEQKSYNIDLVLENGVKLAKGTFWNSNLPDKMPKVIKSHVLFGVIIDGQKRMLAAIQDQKDYEKFMKVFSSSSFTAGGSYSLYSMPKDTTDI